MQLTTTINLFRCAIGNTGRRRIIVRKIIDGRTYNTDTSKKIGSWDNNYYPNDFAYCSEILYKNTKGAYFMYGEGGAMSKYATHQGDSSGWGEEITPFTSEEARVWAEGHLDAEGYEKEFGSPEEAEPSDLTTRERVNLTLDADMMAKLRKLSADTGVPMARMVDKAIIAMYSEQFKD
jgi:hypothetical protein